jgi:NADPH2:quinone reductase
MHAIRHYEFGTADVLRLEELPAPKPSPGQVRIAVHAAGVHLIDASIRSGSDFGSGDRPELPMVPGRDVAGVVDQVGKGVDHAWIGRPVVTYLGPSSGGYAEFAVAAAERLHLVPDGLDHTIAVAAIGTGRTAAGILRLAALKPDDVALVTSAAGGLGVLILQEARAIGTYAIGVAGSPEKLEVASKHGADLAVDHHDSGWADRITQAGLRTTVVFDGVGGQVGRTSYGLLVPGGRLVRYGWASGEQNPYDDPHRRVIDVLGPAMLDLPGGIATLEARALAAAAAGTRVPYVGTLFPLAEAAAAHRALERSAAIGKVVLVTPAALVNHTGPRGESATR